MIYTVNPQDLSEIKLNENNEIASILQNIMIILSTCQHTVPLYREFGLPMEFTDKPIPVASTMMIAEIQEAISVFEPRATFVDISFETDESVPGKLIPIVEVEINE